LTARTILLVEDEAVIAMAEARQLEGEGFRVIQALSGEMALEIILARGETVDLVLMDIDLGEGMDGTEAAEAMLKVRNLPILFLSSHVEKEVVEKTEKITSYGYVAKNSRNVVLLASINMALKLHAARAEASASAERFRSVTSVTQDGFWIVDLEGRIVETNDQYCKISGYTREELLSMRVSDISADGDSDLTALRIRKLQEKGRDRFENKHRRKDGRIIDVEVNATFVESQNLILAFLQDISERRQAERTLRSSESRLATLFDLSPIPIVEEDFSALAGYFARRRAEGVRDFRAWFDARPEEVGACADLVRILDANQACVRFFSAGDKSAILSGLKTYFSDRSLAVFKEELVALADGATTFEFELPVLTPEGHRMVFLTLAVIPNPEANLERVLVSFVDVTERDKAEEALLEKETTLRSLVNSIRDPVALIDLEGRLILANEELAHRVGLGVDELAGKRLIDFFPLEIAQARRLQFEKVVATRKPLRFEDSRDGRHFVNFLNPIFDTRGAVAKIALISFDNTAQREDAENIARLLDEKELLLNEVHHRVKNNLYTIINLLSVQAELTPSEEARGVLLEAGGRIRGMGLLYDKLYRSGGAEPLSLRQYLSPLVEEIIGVFSGGRLVEMDVSIEDIRLEAGTLSALGIIVNELITNSMKHAFHGIARPGISISAALEGDRVVFEYRDNGVGLPESVTPRQTTGFGMQLIEASVRQIRGALTIEGSRGARFLIEFGAKSG
jgi:PAS domain S-box-containing protein